MIKLFHRIFSIYQNLLEKIEFPFCENNEIKSKYFLKKFHHFNKDRFEVAIKWKTRQLKTSFSLKNKNINPSCGIYKGLYSFRETFIVWCLVQFRANFLLEANVIDFWKLL